jgi:flavin-dependent dehydrogenase
MASKWATRTVRRAIDAGKQRLRADLCVAGGGVAGVSAAIEAAKLGAKVVLVDAQPALGGQATNSMIGTFCGLFSNGPEPYQITHGIADGILADLGAQGALSYREGPLTTVILYDEVALGRWIENAVFDAGITVLPGATLRVARREGRRITGLETATRHGDVSIEANAFVDATGDAVLAWLAGLACHQPAGPPVLGTQMMVLEGIDEARQPEREALTGRLKKVAADYDLVRTDGFAFVFAGRGTALVNMTHMETPLDAVAAARIAQEGKRQTDRVLRFLKTEFPGGFADARVRSYGYPGIRQTRWIAGVKQITTEEVREGRRYADAVARAAWPIELHDTPEEVYWEPLGDDHMHYVPLSAMISEEADNLVAAGRCIDGDVAALSSVRVMGPCMATGAAAAHALDLAGSGSVHQLDIAALQERLHDNLERKD